MPADVKVVVKGLLNGEDEADNIYGVYAADAEGTALVHLANEWVHAMYGTILGALSTKYKIIGVAVYVLVGTIWELVGEDIITDLQGVVTSGTLPQQIASVVLGKTAIHKVGGKKFIAGVGEGNDENGVQDPAWIDLLADFAYAWTTNFIGTSGAELIPGVYSKKHNQVYPFNGASVDTVVGTQRRRKQGVGS